MADRQNQNESYFQPVDVSEPTTPRREIDIIEEEIAIRRRAWIKSHMIYIYTAVGIVVVALIFLFIHLYHQGTNPMSRLVSASGKNFSTSFDFDVSLSEDGETVMRYEGAIDVDHADHSIKALYDAVYTDYGFRGVVYADEQNAVKGSYYNGQWTVKDCTDQAQDFFDFDSDYRSGKFDGGSFLRFVGLTSDYSSSELDRFVGILRERLSTNSNVAAITMTKTDDGTVYDYDIDLGAIFEMLVNDGASLFYRSSDYDSFKARYDANVDLIEAASCTMRFTIDPHGYLSTFRLDITVDGTLYTLDCRMDSFGTDVTIPGDFFEAASVTPREN